MSAFKLMFHVLNRFIYCNNNNNNNNNIRLIMVKTNRSTIHTVYNIQQSATQGSNDMTQTDTQDSSNDQV